MPRSVRRLFFAVVAAVVLLLLVVVAEVQLARTGPRLADEDGARPQGLVIGPGRAGPQIEVVWLGDSTTTGVGVVGFTESMVHRTAREASEALDQPVSLTVLGVSGAQIHEVVRDQVSGLDDLEADVVVVSVGANDVTHLTRRPTFATRYRELLDEIARLAPDAEVVVVGIPDMGSVPRFAQPLRSIAGARAAQLDDEVRAAARAAGHQYVDLAAETGPSFRSDPARFFSNDNFHPGAEGQALWGRAVRGEVVTAARRSVG